MMDGAKKERNIFFTKKFLMVNYILLFYQENFCCPVIDTGCPFFQYFATPFSYPAIYTSTAGWLSGGDGSFGYF